ncbi:hypothetical protein BMS_1672 [Halobacteriovorax marinus SJ]|uniref:Uncharacterized protein n=2 Tax=Halobacteriovorax marinus TaxID=97084 RepID=E1X1C1_HALMS|nr:hypothetical protein BMS_1672 [Halobacteriovorax marinus SJ]
MASSYNGAGTSSQGHANRSYEDQNSHQRRTASNSDTFEAEYKVVKEEN